MRAPCPRTMRGQTKTRPDCRPSGRSSTNRVRAALFSDLFNVVASRPAKSPRRPQGNIGTGPAPSSGGSHTTRLLACFARSSLCLPVPASVSLAAPGKPQALSNPDRTYGYRHPPAQAGHSGNRRVRAGREQASRRDQADQAVVQRDAAGAEPEGDRRLQGRRRRAGALSRWIGNSAARGDRGALRAEPDAHRLRRRLRRDPDDAGARLPRRRRRGDLHRARLPPLSHHRAGQRRDAGRRAGDQFAHRHR